MPELDRDRILALSYVPARRRAAVEALWNVDLALGQVLVGGREPLISQIKLAWWREALEKLDAAPAPSEPALEAAARHVLPAGVSGAELARMEAGWAALLSPEPLTGEELATYATMRGGLLFRLTARLLGSASDAAAERAGEAWALVDLARHSGNAADADAVSAARSRGGERRWPSRLRPLGMLAALAARDAEEGARRWEEQGAPTRMLRMLRVRLTGR
ncbi:MAG TPA: squalene/phytoene synthase family protein [Allosphingosinicella sp.]